MIGALIQGYEPLYQKLEVRARALRALVPTQPLRACTPPESNFQELRFIIRVHKGPLIMQTFQDLRIE
jgi:hypothetical protein